MADEVIHLDDQPSTSRSETLQEVQKPLSRLDSKLPHVAREDKVNDILHLLHSLKLPVIAIAVVGMGGVGKTFLLLLSRECRGFGRVDEGHDLIRNFGLPTRQNSKCKIVVTYEVKVFSDEESWELFCTYAFPDCPENRPPHYLIASAHTVERECGNLPLAIKTVGAFMAHKTLPVEWESKSSQLKQVSPLQDSTDPIMSILWFSCGSLPAHLKPCSLYFAFYGEDKEILCEYLVSCWIAEGFIPEGEGQWDLAFHYLDQLNSFFLVEVKETRYLGKYCKVHDLLLDLAISICKENKCVVAVEQAGTKNPSPDGSSSVGAVGFCLLRKV